MQAYILTPTAKHIMAAMVIATQYKSDNVFDCLFTSAAVSLLIGQGSLPNSHLQGTLKDLADAGWLQRSYRVRGLYYSLTDKAIHWLHNCHADAYPYILNCRENDRSDE